jgi:hypothetical protein
MPNTTLIRCLVLNLVVLVGSGALLLWYPKDSGFTITTKMTTHYMDGGVFLGSILVCLFDLMLSIYLAYHLFRLR